jgi:methyl-accepting chemotaxis protein
MTIRTFARAGGVVLLFMILIVAGLAAWRINVIRMGGPLQTQAQQSSDLMADVLAPPAYVIEAYLDATLLARNPGAVGKITKKLERLHNDFNARHEYWAKSGIDETVGRALAASKPSADHFWDEVENKLLPAARANDRVALEASYGQLEAAYAQHRVAIDVVVARSNDYSATLKKSAASTLNGALITLLVLGLIIVGSVGAFCALLLKHFVTPTVELAQATVSLSEGKSAVIPFLDQANELGQIAKAVQHFRQATVARAQADAQSAAEQQRANEELARVLQTLARGDLTEQIEIEFPESYEQTADKLNAAVSTLRTMIQRVVETAHDIHTGADEIATASEDLARRTEGTAASLEQTSATLVQIDARLQGSTTASIGTVARADTALATVNLGRATAEEAVAAMNKVASSAKGTDAVIGGLDKIAFQTRVLAMNAAVEAGRAGDAGRGFAVVADLVSALALRAEEEAKSARDQLTTTQAEIVVALAAVQNVDGALQEIATDVGEVNTLLNGMVADNQAQSLAVSEIASAVSSMDRATQQNAAMVEETSAAAANLSTIVNVMMEHSKNFRFERRVHSTPVAVDRRARGRREVWSPEARAANSSTRRPERVDA